MTRTDQIDAALTAAKQAADAAALATWKRDGEQDSGSCGGAMLEFDARTLVAKRAEALGLAYRSGKEVWLSIKLPQGIHSQNADIPQDAHRAFRAALEAAGLAGAIKRHWTYID